MKTIKILMMLLLTSAFLVSCSSPESDAKKAVELGCEVIEIADEHGWDSDEVKEFEKDNQKYEDELMEKYGEGPDDDKGSASKEDKKAFWNALEDAMKEGCKD